FSNGVTVGVDSSDLLTVNSATTFASATRHINQQPLRFHAGTVAGSNYVALRAPSSIAANVTFARPDTSRARLEQLVDELGISDWVDGLTDGLDTRVGERGDALSAGERQLIALLRAGSADPDVLILDEATSSVDALTEVRISRALQRLSAGRTTIAIAHRLSTAARADRVLVLDHGVLVEDGDHESLVRAGGTYARLYEAWLAATAT
ncbi:MAG: ATP-binding cassette domain-containing protein, partial [Ilumatobacteraceae bacterium]